MNKEVRDLYRQLKSQGWEKVTNIPNRLKHHAPPIITIDYKRYDFTHLGGFEENLYIKTPSQDYVLRMSQSGGKDFTHIFKLIPELGEGLIKYRIAVFEGTNSTGFRNTYSIKDLPPGQDEARGVLVERARRFLNRLDPSLNLQ